MKRLFCILTVLLCGTLSFSQDRQAKKEQILKAVEDYFYMDRESIYVQFAKAAFFTNEAIWFKGFVFNPKESVPYFATTNVYAVLYDDNGNRLNEQLLFCHEGSFSGNFKLGEAVASGRYHLHFYTNFMNNFIEDESAVYTVNVINPESPSITDYSAPNLSNVKIDIYPEGGNLIAGIPNNVAFKVTDCNGIPVGVNEVVVKSNSDVAKIILNSQGIGRTYITPGNASLKATCIVNGQKVEQIFPPVSNSGVGVEINSYAFAGKTLFKFRRTSDTKNQDYFVVIQQNDKANIIDLNLDAPEKEMLIDNENLFPGTNTIRLLDSSLKQIAFRYVYRYPKKNMSIPLTVVGDTNGDLKLASTLPEKTLFGISVLPAGSLCGTSKFDMKSTFTIDYYTGTKSENLGVLLENDTKQNKYLIDLYLLTQTSEKYAWNDILSKPPKMTYDFDIGLTIKGSVGKSISDHKNHRVKMRIPTAFMADYAAVDQKGDFEFPNLVFPDDSRVLFNLLKNPSVPQNFTLTQQVTNRIRGFRKGFRPPIRCEMPMKPINLEDLPDFVPDAIALEEVGIEKKKHTLKRAKMYGNAMLHGVKVTDDNNHTDLLTFLSSVGFNITRSMGQVDITSTMATSLRASPRRPAVYIDGRQVMTFDELDPIHMHDVDEIYYDKYAIIPSMNGMSGIIKVYLRKTILTDNKSITKSALIPKAFAMPEDYQEPLYSGVNSTGFRNYGQMIWIPEAFRGENGRFAVSFPRRSVDEIVIIVEGFSQEGEIFREVKTIKIP